MIELNDVSYSTPNGTALLQNLSLTITANTSTAIMGLNGAGKTTLLKLITRALRPSSGSIKLEGEKLQRLTAKNLARKIAFVPQDFPTDFPFTALEFATMGRHPWQDALFAKPLDAILAAEALRKTELAALSERRLPTLSGGEKQRLLLARALTQQSDIIALDEPLNHLDVKHRIFALDLLQREYFAKGKTIIAVMHDLAIVRKFFTDVIFLKNGKLVFCGKTPEAFSPQLLKSVFDTEFDADGEALLLHA